MNIKELVLKRAAGRTPLRIHDLIGDTKVSRQAIHKHIKELVRQGKLRKLGETRGVFYVRADTPPAPAVTVSKTYLRKGLAEDEVFDRMRRIHRLKELLPLNVLDLFRYAFTEILNNAIEHSRSTRVRVLLHIDPYLARFVVEDAGTGIFATIRNKFHLPDEYTALQELLKGKTTTAARGHTGEGIFFTSRAADSMEIMSHQIGLTYDNRIDDVFVREIRQKRGTRVAFEISRRSRKKLETVFEAFAGRQFDYQFARTSVRVKLFKGTADFYVSRSEARRLLHGLDRFKHIVLDFKGIRGIGQGFADELFRVFAARHPRIALEPVHANAAVAAMIRHAMNPGAVPGRIRR
ncbi:MAG: hypothetical protein A3J70_01450 [Elusimicrobia bacterium RIFCSPHIGHO2_02_FULL_61_10]|nr:MAG: hypothetical protein A3J70_01450 [Elusimicrobia bacterium RIFCSPHIGHO2_02_FULL_61_10]